MNENDLIESGKVYGLRVKCCSENSEQILEESTNYHDSLNAAAKSFELLSEAMSYTQKGPTWIIELFEVDSIKCSVIDDSARKSLNGN